MHDGGGHFSGDFGGHAPHTGTIPGFIMGTMGTASTAATACPGTPLPARAVWAAQDGRGGRAQMHLHM